MNKLKLKLAHLENKKGEIISFNDEDWQFDNYTVKIEEEWVSWCKLIFSKIQTSSSGGFFDENESPQLSFEENKEVILENPSNLNEFEKTVLKWLTCNDFDL